MILMPQIFDVTANENACYKLNELEFMLLIYKIFGKKEIIIIVNIQAQSCIICPLKLLSVASVPASDLAKEAK